jgi:hypothetical protein
MVDDLPPLALTRKTGDERLHDGGRPLPSTLLSFWQWSGSDLVSNTIRGRLAEFIVGTALGVDLSGVRREWDAVDLITRDGIKVEVKSAAYIQTWRQRRLSSIAWQVAARRAWDPDTNILSSESRRHADVYVLALLHHQDKPAIDPLDVGHWQFFVLSARSLDARRRSQHSITLNSVRGLCSAVPFGDLAKEVERAWTEQRSAR